MFTCNKCGSVYLRRSEALDCASQAIETPVIEVGATLIDSSYDVDTVVRCYAINPRGHEIVYDFEWQQSDAGEYGHLYTVYGNEGLDFFYDEQKRSD
ncbi:hypothetical protein ACFSTH_11795 [Paenibacillus yanchengensis]|uniref:Uncharacterized protein n=1 Tax=Paenibacillus yanchengensis TaxID=2035833 RepID=A0ABW4YR36_9BACL